MPLGNEEAKETEKTGRSNRKWCGVRESGTADAVNLSSRQLALCPSPAGVEPTSRSLHLPFFTLTYNAVFRRVPRQINFPSSLFVSWEIDFDLRHVLGFRVIWDCRIRGHVISSRNRSLQRMPMATRILVLRTGTHGLIDCTLLVAREARRHLNVNIEYSSFQCVVDAQGPLTIRDLEIRPVWSRK